MKSNRISRFLGGAWHALDIVRRLVHLGLMLLVLLFFLAIFGSRTVPVPDVFVLVIDPEGNLTEQLAGEPLERALAEAEGDGRTQTLVGDLVEAIDAGAGDDRVKAIYLDVSYMGGGSVDKLKAVADALDRFKATGKPVVGYGVFLDQSRYFLAAQADELYLDPGGLVMLDGLGYYRPYFAEALDKLSIDWHVFRTGDYKSYGDGYVRNDMSDAEKEEIRPVLDGLWSAYRDDVARVRNLDPGRVDAYINQVLARLKAAGGDSARMAVEAGLVDELWTHDQVENRLAEIAERDPDTGSFVGLGFRDYLDASGAGKDALTGPAVGLIVASGDILPGDQPAGAIGGETLSGMIRDARQDPDIKAVVLRVDSGGGSMFAAERIAREVELVRQSGKPMLISMGSVAASGGYLISLPADEIWAQPTTITGSIGVFAAFPTVDRALGRLGVNVDGIGTHRFSGDLRLDRPMSDEASELVQTFVDGSYARFLEMVATSRGMDVASVRRVAGGRVWLGDAAQRLGLVDRMGSLRDVLDAAAGRAGLGAGYRVRRLEPPMTFGQQLMIRLFTALQRTGVGLPAMGPGLPAPLGEVVSELSRQLTRFSDPRGLYAHCLCDPAGR